MNEELQAWQWPEERWRGMVERVRAGRTLRPRHWPHGARCAIALSFDSGHESSALGDASASVGRLSQRQYGNRQGIPRILEILSRHGVRASFHVPGVTALLHPDEQRHIADEGHEIALHGWIHERSSGLPEAAERELMLRSADTLEKIVGRRPLGMRTPARDFSPATLAIARDMGLQYDSSLMADVDCHELLLDGQPTGMVELPVSWIRDDATYFDMDRPAGPRPCTPPADVFDVFRRELDAAYREGGIFQVTLHPHISGYRSRIWILEDLILHAKNLGRVWFATQADIVRHVSLPG